MATYSSFSEEAAARASMTPEPGEAAAAPRRRSKGASSPAALELRQRIRAASPFMQSVAPQVLAAMGEASEAGSAQASARRSTARSTARSAALPEGASAPPWKSTANEDLLPFVCHRCQACTAYHNGVADVIGTSLKATQDYQEPAYQSPSFLLVGNEAQGLPADYEAQCDLLVKMPMRGKADSLNAAVATAVMAYELLNQRRKTS